MENYKDFRKVIDYLFPPGASTNFYGVIGEDGLRRGGGVKTYENI